MTYFVIENFGHGLDARKHILNLPPGALYTAKNVNISRGGEPESAKAFILKTALPHGPGAWDRTFGFLACGGKIYVFGSYDFAAADIPNGITYQRLLHPAGGYMTDVIVQTPVKGKPFVVATFATGHGVFFNGVIIDDWLPPSGTAVLKETGIFPLGDWKRHGATPYTVANYAEVADNFAAQINTVSGYSATSAGAVVTITGPPNQAFACVAAATNGGAVNDQTMNVVTTQASAAPFVGVQATNIFTYDATMLDWPTPLLRTDRITVNGSAICGEIWAKTRQECAQLTADAINNFNSVPKYTATSNGTAVTIIAGPGTGSIPNGQPVAVNCSSVAGGGVMAGGVDPVTGKPQISTVTFGGTFEGGDLYSISIGVASFTVAAVLPGGGSGGGGSDTGGAGGGVTATNGIMPVAVVPKNSKTYAISGPNMFGSAIGDCTEWNTGTGAFITDMSSELAGAENLTAMALFQGNLAVFSRSTTQIRFVDPDPKLNEQVQAMQNIGTMAPKSLTPYGGSDLFFLSDTGIRSLKLRSNTDSSAISDIGSPIDPLIIAAIKAVGTPGAQRAVGAVEPVDGRFMLQIGTTTYVFSFFPDAKVAAWTIYETGLAITDFAVIDTRLYARAGDYAYLLGGDNNDQYTAQAPEIRIPYLNARQLATLKHFTAFDVVCDGVFDVMMSTDPAQPNAEEVIATLNGSTAAIGIAPFAGEDCTAISLRFVGRGSKYSRLSGIAVHYEPMGELAP